jgi:hypothetical protein
LQNTPAVLWISAISINFYQFPSFCFFLGIPWLHRRLRSDAALSDATANACEAASEASAAQETLGAFDVPGLVRQMRQQREKSPWIRLGSVRFG